MGPCGISHIPTRSILCVCCGRALEEMEAGGRMDSGDMVRSRGQIALLPIIFWALEFELGSILSIVFFLPGNSFTRLRERVKASFIIWLSA